MGCVGRLGSGEITASICCGLRKRRMDHDRKCASADRSYASNHHP